MARTVTCPAVDAPLIEVLRFALSFNGYQRLGRDASSLRKVVEPVLGLLEAGEQIPTSAGLDLVRGALFFIQRMTHHWGDVPAEQEHQMRVLVAAIHNLSGGRDPWPTMTFTN